MSQDLANGLSAPLQRVCGDYSRSTYSARSTEKLLPFLQTKF